MSQPAARTPGATRAGNFLELPDDAWLDGFALKFFGAVRLTRLPCLSISPTMRKNVS